jgi:hypothetical protein
MDSSVPRRIHRHGFAVSGGIDAVILHHARATTPGRTYLVQGDRMHMDCMGSGSPSLILDEGTGL